MRSLFFILVVFAFSATAQTPFVKQVYERATAAAQAKQLDAAIADYRRILLLAEAERQNDDFLARVHFNLGICFYHRRRTNEAVTEFTEAIKLSRRTYQKAFYALGMAQGALQNWQAAETAFRDAVELKKTDGEAWFDLALICLKTKNYESAETAFRHSIKYKSVAAADAHNNLGVIFALRREFLPAEKEFQTALNESRGESVEARNNLQFCKLYREKNQAADLIAKLEFSRYKE